MIRRILTIALAAVRTSAALVAPAPRPAAAAECQAFPPTGQQVCGRFLEHWQANGGLAQQGLPISDAFDEVNPTDGKTYRTQYFERARFEYHPEQAQPYQVLLGLLGREQLLQRYAALQPTALREVYSSGFAAPFPGTAKAVGSAAATYLPYGPGRLRIAGDGSLTLATAGVPGGQSGDAPLQDLRVEAGVIQTGAGDSSFGLICRSRADGAALEAVVGGGRIVFAAIAPAGAPISGNVMLDQPLPAGLLAPVGQTNSLHLDCVGGTMSLTLNGARVAEVSNLTPAAGGFGLEAFVKQGSAVNIDSLVVTAVDPLP